MALAEGKKDEAREHLEYTLAASGTKNKPVWALRGFFGPEAGEGNWQEALNLLTGLLHVAALKSLTQSD